MGIASLLVVLVGFLELPDVECEMLQVVRPLPVQKEILDQLSLGSVTINFRGDGLPFGLEFRVADDVVVTGQIGVSMGSEVLLAKPEACASPADNAVCALWPESGISVQLYQDEPCVTVEWSGELTQTSDCFETSPGSHWYGGGEQYRQPWPLELQERLNFPFVTGDMLQNETAFYGGLIERYFLNSRGMGIYISPDVPLFHTVTNGTLCFNGKVELPFKAPELELPSSNFLFKYDLCSAGIDPRETHVEMARKFISAPVSAPDERMIRAPIWSSWARFKENVNESVILAFAEEISSNGYPNAQVEIDDNWETCYGELSFDPEKFPDPARMIRDLNDMGYRTTVWVHPFMNSNCEQYPIASDAKYFILNGAKNQTAWSVWWKGFGGLVDFTNPRAVEWFTGRLEKLRAETGIDSFKFDAGEVNWIARDYSLFDATLMSQPEAFSTRYVDIVSHFGPMAEVRTGRRNQNAGIYFRMLDKLSVWGDANGLATLIPSLLHSNFIGYPFVLPDMIGGNGYSEGFPNKELFIRWLQANVFMPTLQFSYCPWQYDEETNQISKRFVQLHEEFSDIIIELTRQAVDNPGFMVNRPIWWIDPFDERALTVSDEFLLGDSILVAPVLEEGETSRDIYLPRGRWEDQVSEDRPVYEGPITLENYPAPLDVLPYFIAVP